MVLLYSAILMYADCINMCLSIYVLTHRSEPNSLKYIMRSDAVSTCLSLSSRDLRPLGPLIGNQRALLAKCCRATARDTETHG